MFTLLIYLLTTPKKTTIIFDRQPIIIQEPQNCGLSEDNTEKIVDVIYRLESSGGRNDSCKKEGKFNGFGYGQYKGSYICFDSLEEVREKVKSWIEDKREKGMTDDELLCYYNTGKVLNDCEYLKKFKKIYEKK